MIRTGLTVSIEGSILLYADTIRPLFLFYLFRADCIGLISMEALCRSPELYYRYSVKSYFNDMSLIILHKIFHVS